jgi:ATP-dependent exoDNAse (exonuclease V) beta subunit
MHDESRIMAIDAPDRQRLQRVRDVLDRTFAKRPASLRGWIEGAWVFLGGPACANAAEDLEDAAAFFDLLEEMDEGGTLDAAGFESQIEKLYANPDALADDAIQVMSIHKAKGLQFDTVIVPGLGRKPRSDDSRLMLWLERPRFQERSDLLLAPIHATGADEDTIYSYLKGIDARKAEYEAGRMLYVAATRAKNELHLLGHTAWKEKDGVMELSLPQSSSLLRRMWTVAEPLFQQVAREVAVPAAAAEAISTREPQRLERLAAGWALPAPPSGPAVGELDAETDDEKPMSFYWVGNTLRHIGTVVHEVLQRIGQDGLAAWTPERVRALAPAFRSALSSLGVPTAELDNAAGRAADAVLGTLRDERGRWILRNDRAATACEYPICGVIDSRVVSVRVDRTFVDSDGTRWIIDYKTSFHEGSGIDAFLDNELARYRGQMTAYTRLFAVMEDRPVRTALYFPLLGSWRELERTFAQG